MRLCVVYVLIQVSEEGEKRRLNVKEFSKFCNAGSSIFISFFPSTGYLSLPQLNSISLSVSPTHTPFLSHSPSHSHSHNTILSHSSSLSLTLTPTGVEDVSMMTGEEVNAYDAFLVFLNGLIVGVHTKPTQLVEKGRSKVQNQRFDAQNQRSRILVSM